MTPAKRKLSDWASGAQDAQDQGQMERWANGEDARPARLSAALLKRIGAWAGGEESAPPAPTQPRPAASQPRPAQPKPAAASQPKPAAQAQPKPAASSKPKPAASAQPSMRGELTARLAALQDDLALSGLKRQLQEARKTFNAASARLRECRSRGYVFQKQLEESAAGLEKQASELRARLDEQSAGLQREASQVEGRLTRGAADEAQATSALDVLENKIKAAAAVSQGDCQALQGGALQIAASVERIAWALEQLEQASFKLLASEALIDTVQAVWKRAGSSMDVKGLLYLTDLRLLFERKDEIATEKVLFVTTATQKLQNLEWEGPVQLIEKALSSQQGLLGTQEQLTIHFAAQGPAPQLTLLLKEAGGTPVSSHAWSALIGRARSGVIDLERTTPLDPQAAAVKLPSHCPSCGAVFNQVVLRGQREVNCQYCGQPIRL